MPIDDDIESVLAHFDHLDSGLSAIADKNGGKSASQIAAELAAMREAEGMGDPYLTVLAEGTQPLLCPTLTQEEPFQPSDDETAV